MRDFAQYSQLLEPELQLTDLPDEPAGLYEPIRYILSLGGKRVRPAAVLMAAEAYGGSIGDAMPLAVAVEVFHNFTLMHDDIMDQAPLRRGKETVHKRWNTTIAILSGDAMMVKAYEHLIRCQPGILKPVLELFNKTAREVCEGQQLDMEFEGRESVTLEGYLEMIRLKTAVLLGASFRFGTMAAGALEADQQAMYNFGLNLGLAFQLQDDYLDCFAPDGSFGKQPGGDILANKKTFLLLKAFENSGKEGAARLKELMVLGADDKKVDEVRSFYREFGVGEAAREAISSYTNLALHALEATTLQPPQRQAFQSLATALLSRVS